MRYASGWGRCDRCDRCADPIPYAFVACVGCRMISLYYLIMNNFFEKSSYTEDDINGLITNQIEEAIDLEFKDAAALDNTDSNKIQISKDVASFANSAGGIIVYGINETEHKATSISFINGNRVTKEWLDQVIHSNIKQKIENIEIKPVRFGNDIAQTVYIVKIPQSNTGPHMSRDNKYYRRYNFQSVPMEEYEVRNLYYMTHRTELEILDIVMVGHSRTGSPQSGIHNVRFNLQFKLFNSGKSIENNYKLKLCVPNKIFYYDQPGAIKDVLENQNDHHAILSFPNRSPLFQEETAFSGIFSVQIVKRTFDNLENFLLMAALYYSNGMKEYKFDLRNHLKIEDIPIQEVRFVGD